MLLSAAYGVSKRNVEYTVLLQKYTQNVTVGVHGLKVAPENYALRLKFSQTIMNNNWENI